MQQKLVQPTQTSAACGKEERTCDGGYSENTPRVSDVQKCLESATCSSHLPFLQEGPEGRNPSPRAH